MIKKSLAAVALVFVIIFAGSQSNVAEAKEVYIGTFGNRWIDFLKGKDCYLWDNSVRMNSYSVHNSMLIQCSTGVTNFGRLDFTFRRISTKDWVFMFSFGNSFGGGNSGVINVNWNDVEGKLLSYILNNYD